jgi:hypothetical protein
MLRRLLSSFACVQKNLLQQQQQQTLFKIAASQIKFYNSDVNNAGRTGLFPMFQAAHGSLFSINIIFVSHRRQ